MAIKKDYLLEEHGRGDPYDNIKSQAYKQTSPEELQAMRTQFFNQRRAQAEGQATAAGQEQQDVIGRRFAALGQSGSGAYLKAMQNQAIQNQQAKAGALGDITGQEAGANAQAAAQANQMGFAQNQADVAQANTLRQLDMAERQFRIDADTTSFNRRMAELAHEADAEGSGGGLGGALGGALSGGMTGAATGFMLGGPAGAAYGAAAGGGIGAISGSQKRRR